MTKDEMKNKISMALKDTILQQGFEIICKNLIELEKDLNYQKQARVIAENAVAELTEENNRLLEKIADLEKKVNENDVCIEDLELSNIDLQKQLEQAKEIIKKFLSLRHDCKDKDCPCESPICETIDEQAEQFLKEIEK